MAIVTVSIGVEHKELPISEIVYGQLFFGKFSGDVHLRTNTGSVRLTDSFSFTTKDLNAFGPYELVPEGTTVILEQANRDYRY